MHISQKKILKLEILLQEMKDARMEFFMVLIELKIAFNAIDP